MKLILVLSIVIYVFGFVVASDGQKHRAFILTDIENEPDDAMSMVRTLTYSNDVELQGIAAVTSVWLRGPTKEESIIEIIDAYAKVVDNLRKHSDNDYPDADYLKSLVVPGQQHYGMDDVGDGKDTAGSEKLIEVVDKEDERPLYVLGWGGVNTLAQCLHKVKNTRSQEEVDKFISKMRVYTISDQDDAGPWIRRNFPKLTYIVSIHKMNDYGLATWQGISVDGEHLEMVQEEWLRNNIQIGPLGSAYPDVEFLMEGDTPTFLYLIPTGLGNPEHPNYGSWGGRYGKVEDKEANLWSDASDTVPGGNKSGKATIYRWREAFQNDFAARMQWSIQDRYENANHPPSVVVNNDTTQGEIYAKVQTNGTLEFDASMSQDPDGDDLSFMWCQYKEVDLVTNNADDEVPDFDFRGTENSSTISITAPGDIRFRDYYYGSRQFHIILQVTDNGTPSLTRYRRIIVDVFEESGHD